MKVSAMPAGSAGSPGVDLGNIHLGVTASPERIAAAKAIASGQEIEETEKDTTRDHNVRKITMRTNVSPNRFDAVEPVEAATDSTTADVGGQTNVAVESTQPLSPQFAALAKQRRALQVKERELATREAKLGQPPENSGDYLSKADLLANPLKIFDAGLTYDQLAEAILGSQSGNTPEIKALKEELKALKEGVDNKFQSQAEKQEESALMQIADDMESLSKEGDAYEMFRERKGLEKALNKVYSHYKKTGQVLDSKEVMNQIESQLLDEAIKLASYNKVKSKLAPAPVQPPQSEGKQMRTLTSRDGASIPLDRKARAIAAMNGTLRK